MALCSATEVSAAIKALPSRNELAVHSRRAVAVIECAETVLKLCELEQFQLKFASFSAVLLSALNSTIEGKDSFTGKRKKMWEKYSVLRCEKLPSLWKRFFCELHLNVTEQLLFAELTNDLLFEKIIKNNCSAAPSSQHRRPQTELTSDEENIIRYVSGYVGKKLHDHYIKQKSEKAALFMEIIDKMYVDGPATSPLDYSREWVDRVNRGGLFDISDETYVLFFWIEEIMRDILTSHIKSSALLTSDGSEERKKALVESIVFDCDIQYRWYAFSSSDYIEESDSIELLTHFGSPSEDSPYLKLGWKITRLKQLQQPEQRKASEKSCQRAQLHLITSNSHSYHSYITHVCTYILYNYS